MKKKVKINLYFIRSVYDLHLKCIHFVGIANNHNDECSLYYNIFVIKVDTRKY